MSLILFIYFYQDLNESSFPPLFAYNMYYMHSHTLHRYIRNLHTCLEFLLLLPIFNQNTRVFKKFSLITKSSK